MFAEEPAAFCNAAGFSILRISSEDPNGLRFRIAPRERLRYIRRFALL